MTEYLTEEQAIAAIPGLSQSRLVGFVVAELVVPIATAQGPMLRRVDVARIALLCDLVDDFDLEDDALGVVIGLIDQLHVNRLHLHAMAQAIETEPTELRQRLGARFLEILSG